MNDTDRDRYELTDAERAELEQWLAEVNTINEPLNDRDNRDGPAFGQPVAA